MFFLAAFCLMAGILATASTQGGRPAFWGGWFVALLLLPSWLAFPCGSLLLDLRTVAAVTGLIALTIGRKVDDAEEPAFTFRLLPADVVIVALVLVQCYSQLRIDRFGPLTGPEIARKWLLPYLVGRIFLRSARDLDRVAPLAARLFLGLSVYAIVEALIKFNPINRLLGKTYGLLEQGEGYRWGLKRAQGPVDHPIFFGMMLVLLFPWAVEASLRAWRGRGPRWWLLLTPALLAAILVTVSRGAQIAVALTIAVTVFFQLPRWRVHFVVLALVIGLGAVAGKELISEGLSRWAGESKEETRLLEINGEEVEYTGTNHRILLFKVYEHALRNVDTFGYGYELRGIELEESIAQRFGSIDDHYILFLLQHGYAALGAFLILAILATLDLGILAWDVRNPTASFAAVSCGSMAAVTVSLLSVWFAPDFGMVWLFAAGLASNLRNLPVNLESPGPSASDSPTETEARDRRPRLTPASAPIRRRNDPQEPGR